MNIQTKYDMKTGTVRPAVLYTIYMFNNIYTFCKNSILSVLNIYVSSLDNIRNTIFEVRASQAVV